MNEATMNRLETSFSLLAPRGPELVDRFYAMLFATNPGVRAMFPKDLTDQKNKLLASLVLVIRNIRNAESLRGPLMEMGSRHAGYGTKPEHYPVVRDTLISVMTDMAGPAWTTQLTQDWTTAINIVASIMIEGAKVLTPSATR